MTSVPGRLLAWTVALAVAACGGPQERVIPEVAFDLPPDTILTRYVNVPVAAWVGGERWVVVAGEFDEAILADFDSGRLTRLGGRGDAELRNPFAVFGWADTAYVADWSLRRVTLWTSDGRFAGAFPSIEPLRGAFPVARDREGRLYVDMKPRPGRDGTGARDSAAVIRVGPDMASFDTVVRLAPLDLAEVEDQGGRRFERRVFSGEDQWGVHPDGTVWVARVYTNLIEVHGPDGRMSRSERLPDRVLEVTRTDREHFLLQFPEELRSTADRIPVSPIKPPFENALGGTGGTVWLEKSRTVFDSTRSYQVVEADAGVLSHVAVLPIKQGRIIALGDSLALVAEQYRDGVRLMQVRIPAPPPGPGGSP